MQPAAVLTSSTRLIGGYQISGVGLSTRALLKKGLGRVLPLPPAKWEFND